MTTELFESACNGAMIVKRGLKTFESFEAAKLYAHATYDILYFSEDEDFPGCADFITRAATIFAIQPVGFKVSGIAA